MGKVVFVAFLVWFFEVIAMLIVSTFWPNVLEWNTFNAGLAFSLLALVPAAMSYMCWR